MECPVCCEPWDLLQVRPKNLPCAHSVCDTCLDGLRKRNCPTCRKAFADPVEDNHSLIAVLESTSGLKKPLTWWCVDCKTVSSDGCVEQEHNVKRPKAALRRDLDGLVARCSEYLEELQDCVPQTKDTAALNAVRLLNGRPSFKLVMFPDGEKDNTVSFTWSTDGQQCAENDLAKALVVALASSSGQVQLETVEVHQEAVKVHQEAVKVHQEAAASGMKRKLTAPLEHHAPLKGRRIEQRDLGGLSISDPDENQDDKAGALLDLRRHGVQRLSGLKCNYDSAWSLDVLRAAASTLQELQLLSPRPEHFAVVQTMAHLRRLHVLVNPYDSYNYGAMQPAKLPVPPEPSCLKWLRVKGLSRLTTQSLIKSHAASLAVLWLEVAASPGERWPKGCGDLDAFLRPCGLNKLTRLVLLRSGCDAAACRAQVEAALRVLPGCTVQCDFCDGVKREAF